MAGVKKFAWLAWRWFNCSGGPGKWSLEHAIAEGSDHTLCGRRVPEPPRIFDRHGQTGQDQCKKCLRLRGKHDHQ